MYEEKRAQDINDLYVMVNEMDDHIYRIDSEVNSVRAEALNSACMVEDALEVFRDQIEKQILKSFSQLRDLFKEHFENGEAEITDEELRQILLW